MDCCQVAGIENYMDSKMAEKELSHYRKKGPDKTTLRLLDFLQKVGVRDLTLLDIGGGIGALQHELFKSGIKEATSVDASSAYLEAARNESEYQGTQERLMQQHGDFVELAEEVGKADIVTLDRVICCYDDMERLVGLSAERALKYYGVVYPKDNILVKVLTWIENHYYRLKRTQFRAFTHSNSAIDGVIREAGLERIFSQSTLYWQVQVYRRLSDSP